MARGGAAAGLGRHHAPPHPVVRSGNQRCRANRRRCRRRRGRPDDIAEADRGSWEWLSAYRSQVREDGCRGRRGAWPAGQPHERREVRQAREVLGREHGACRNARCRRPVPVEPRLHRRPCHCRRHSLERARLGRRRSPHVLHRQQGLSHRRARLRTVGGICRKPTTPDPDRQE